MAGIRALLPPNKNASCLYRMAAKTACKTACKGQIQNLRGRKMVSLWSGIEAFVNQKCQETFAKTVGEKPNTSVMN